MSKTNLNTTTNTTNVIKRIMVIMGIIAAIALLVIGLSCIGLFYIQPDAPRETLVLSGCTAVASSLVGGLALFALFALSIRHMRFCAYLLMLSSICAMIGSLRLVIGTYLGINLYSALLAVYASFPSLALTILLSLRPDHHD